MDIKAPVSSALAALPVEILLQTFELFPTRELVHFASTCRRIHAIVLRLVAARLQRAALLGSYCLYLECHPPSARLTASSTFCLPLGTEGLDELCLDITNAETCVGQLDRCGKLFSRFRPQRRQAPYRPTWRVPGDIAGTRTFERDNAASSAKPDPDETVKDTITIDAHELFSQLSASAYLGRFEYARGWLSSTKDVCDGTIRVWRNWLAKHCESKRWTDGEAIVVHHHMPQSRDRKVTAVENIVADPGILWINTPRETVGIRFRVKKKRWRGTNPVLYASEEEVTVSYEVEFEEMLVRTTHLLLKLEEGEESSGAGSGKAIIFGSFRTTG